ncbi:MAG: hypothetical protein IPO92_05145 [Saprospiraceae bacterium]|nr:hypothetical protein [Saprospiraceae bacterium]
MDHFGSDKHNAGTESVWGKADPGTAINKLNLGALEGQNIEGLKTHRMFYSKEIITNAGYKKCLMMHFLTCLKMKDIQGKGQVLL